MNSKRIVFLLLAVVVAGVTAFLARTWLQSERAAIAAQFGGQRQVAAKPAVQVLVARTAIRTGQLVKPDDLRWQPWPQGNLPPSYIIEGKRPISDFVGAVARSQFHVGAPIVETDIVMPGSRGFLAAVLKPGLRAVSVPATATSTVSGFVYAGDRVDVLLTHALTGTSGQGQHNATETILRNARVIAMDQKLDFTPGDKPDVAKTATLELTAKQTEIVTLAVKMGELSLVLRSLQDPPDEERDVAGGDDATAELGDSYTFDNQVSRLIKDPNPPPKPPDAMKTSVFVLRGGRGTKQELDGSIASDPTNGPSPSESEGAKPEGAKPGAPRTSTFNRTQESVPQ
jgi:pilus assembly protein CpaB